MMKKRLPFVIFPVLLTAAHPLPKGVGHAPICKMAMADWAWLQQALANWRTAERSLLKLRPAQLPMIVTGDARCIYALDAGANSAKNWVGRVHDGTLVMPDGKRLPIGPISFASASERRGQPSYFAMTLPSVWRSAGVKSGLQLERLMYGVMLHELMHSRQFYFATARLAAIAARYKVKEDVGDDSLQGRFEKDAEYTAAYRNERDLLFSAAAAQDDREARQLAASALTLLRARRDRWFGGPQASWTQYDDVFLTMEGLGQWLAYSWYVSPDGLHLGPKQALREVRRGGKYWTQDEGLALFLVIDRLLPGWQKLAFAHEPLLAEALLARAAQRKATP